MTENSPHSSENAPNSPFTQGNVPLMPLMRVKSTLNSPVAPSKQIKKILTQEIPILANRLEGKMQPSFDSPKRQKVAKLAHHTFKCSCEPSSEPFACQSALYWLHLTQRGRKTDIRKLNRVYKDLLLQKESFQNEEQIKKDVNRTFTDDHIFP